MNVKYNLVRIAHASQHWWSSVNELFYEWNLRCCLVKVDKKDR